MQLSRSKNTADDIFLILWLAGLYFMLTAWFRGFAAPRSVLRLAPLPTTWTQHGSQTRWDVAARLSETFNPSRDDIKITTIKFEPFHYLVSRFLHLIMWRINMTAVHERESCLYHWSTEAMSDLITN